MNHPMAHLSGPSFWTLAREIPCSHRSLRMNLMLSAVGGNVAAHPGCMKEDGWTPSHPMRWVKTNEITIWLGEQLSINQQIPNHNHVPFLVGGLEHVLFFHILGSFILPTDELICFRGVGQPPSSFVWWKIMPLRKGKQPAQALICTRSGSQTGKGKQFFWGWSSGDDVDWLGEVSTYPGLSSWWFNGDLMVI